MIFSSAGAIAGWKIWSERLHSTRGYLRSVVLAMLLALACAQAALAQSLSPYNPQTGPFRVLTVDRLLLHDSARGKYLPVKIYYPDGPGPFPVIIFSHGALASKDAYWGLGLYWASFGYISIHPSHADSILDSGFRGTLRDAILNAKFWRERPRDISFVIDSLSEIEETAPVLKGRMDLQHIGVGGHSFGAYTAQAIGGATVTMPDGTQQSFADRRVSAVLMLSPQGHGQMGLTEHSWDSFRVPMLLMFGSRDFGPFGQKPAWRSEPFQKAPSGDKYKVELSGATHMGFAGPWLRTGQQSEVFHCTKLESIAFWDAYLKGKPAAKQFLRDRALLQYSAHAGSFDRK